MVSEQREREIRERMAALGKVPWEIGPYPGSLLLLSDTLVYESANPGPFREIAVTQPGVATAMQHMREDLTCLLDEVAFLRGQLADLCEDSRAVAEVARLRQVLADIARRIGFYMDLMAKSGCQLALCKMVLKDMAGLKEIAQRGLAADQDILARRAVDLASFSVRVRKGFKRIGINTVADLLAYREMDLLCKIKGFGQACLLEVKNALAAHGLKLAE